MKHKPRLLACLAVVGWSVVGRAEPRVWTNNEGNKVTAELLRVDGDSVVLRLAGGKQAGIQIATLSAGDQAWLRDNAGKASAPVSEGGRPPWDRRYMPATVQGPMSDLDIKVVKEAPGNCIYESAHFQFRTTAKLGALVMRDICGAFESTHELVRRLPWGVFPVPEEGRTKFRAELFESRDDYLATGAPPWSGGVYVLKDKVFRMPFEELGLTRAPTNKTAGYARSGPINNDTITHEITHQMMHEYLPFAPVWFVEGTAEYTAHLPYHSGEFNVAGAVQAFKEMRDNARKPQRRRLFRSLSYSPAWIGVQDLWGYTTDITQRSEAPGTPPRTESGGKGKRKQALKGGAPGLDPKTLADRYYSSHALVFYFMHLDAGGGAARLKKYFDAIYEEKGRWAVFWPAMAAYRKKLDELRPAYDAYEKAMKAFMAQPGVKDLGNGRISYPSDLKLPTAPPPPPEAPKPPDGTGPDVVCVKHLDALLDGRTLGQLEQEIRSAFAKASISL